MAEADQGFLLECEFFRWSCYDRGLRIFGNRTHKLEELDSVYPCDATAQDAHGTTQCGRKMSKLARIQYAAIASMNGAIIGFLSAFSVLHDFCLLTVEAQTASKVKSLCSFSRWVGKSRLTKMPASQLILGCGH